MNKHFFKGWTSLVALAMIAMVTMVSCNDDDDDNGTPPVLVEDGLYIQGAGTALTGLNGDGLMTVAINEVDKATRATLYEMYVAVKGGSDGFNIVNVVGGAATTWGPGADFAMVAEADLDVDEPSDIWRGGYAESEAAFTVSEDGLYHIAVDTELGIVAVSKVVWGLIGGATPGGWSDDTPMTMGAFDLNTLTFTVEDVTMLESAWKFRYSGGWKVFMDTEGTVKINTNFGGSVDALEAGGGDIPNAEYAIYKFTMTWSLTDGHSATQTKTAEAEPLPEYPEELYMIGGALNLEDSDDNGTPDGWQWELTDMPMIPVHSHANAFWKIVWLEASEGVKFAPQREWLGDFGSADDTQPGVGDHLKGSSNVAAPAEAGYYMVWIDLERDSISVTVPEVYLLGDAIGSWDTPNADALFTVDNANEKLTITKTLVADATLRMYAWHKWHYDWWQHELMILSDMIEFRGAGDDQVSVSVVAGDATIDMNFKTLAGSITQ